MRFCDRCQASVPKHAKLIQTRHKQWVCEPCHEEEVRELKAKAQAHLQEKKAHPGQGPSRAGLWIGALVGIAALGVAGFLLTQERGEAMGLEESRDAYYRWRHPDLLERVAVGAVLSQEDIERVRRRAEAARAAEDDPAYQALVRGLRDELGARRSLLADPAAFEWEGRPCVFVTEEWHGLSAADQLSAVEDCDRAVAAAFHETRPWSVHDGRAPVGGRREDGLWASKDDYEKAHSSP